MTDLLDRSPDPGADASDRRPRGDRRDGTERRPPYAAGVWGALGAVTAGVGAVVLLTVALVVGDGRSTVPVASAARTGLAMWMLAHGAALHVTEGTVSLLPLGVTLGVAELLRRAGRAVGRRCPASSQRRDIPLATLTVVLPYTLLVTAAGTVAGAGTAAGAAGLRVDVLRGGLGALLLSAAAVGLGVTGVLAPDRLAFLRRGGRVVRLSGPQRTPVRVVLRAAVAACAVYVAGAAAVVAVSLAVHASATAALIRDTDGGFVGHSGVLVVQLALVPNLVLWFVGYLAGPGFGVGSGTAVSVLHPHLGEVPALPVFAALPGHAASATLVAVVVVPLVAGLLAGRLVAGELRASGRAARTAFAFAAGPVAACFVLVLTALASGAVLGGALAHVGARPVPTAVAVAVEVGVFAVLGEWVTTAWRRHRDRRRSTSIAAAAPGGSPAPTGGHRRTGRWRPPRLPGFARVKAGLSGAVGRFRRPRPAGDDH